MRKKKFPERPSAEAYFGQPDSCADLVNQYGTYNIQPTADADNLFPLIANGLPEEWTNRKIGKEEQEKADGPEK